MTDLTQKTARQPRWARLIIARGDLAVAHAKAQSVFTEDRSMGGISCTMVPEELIDEIMDLIREHKKYWPDEVDPKEDLEGEHFIGTEEGKH